MNIPLDNLYQWIEGQCPSGALLYCFCPHGSKSITDLDFYRVYSSFEERLWPNIICHDQEPLNYNFYNFFDRPTISKLRGSVDLDAEQVQQLNLRAATSTSSIYDKIILIHSEKNSNDLDRYQQENYIGVHYWSHAVIARDWFRFALHDSRLQIKHSNNQKKMFLIYLRGWSGSREYRLKFAEMLQAMSLLNNSKTSIQKTNEHGQQPQHYQFENKNFCIKDFKFLDEFEDNTYSSDISADYVPEDFVDTSISVVLETVFDNRKIHLTEKILRPIACGHPFILAAGPGSLEYIRSYGFKTFSPWIDESYDQETDSVRRLEKIIAAMKELNSMPPDKFTEAYCNLDKIAAFNKERFFSQDFYNMLSAELKQNLITAFEQVNQTRGSFFLSRVKPKVYNNYALRAEQIKKLRQLRKK